MWTRRIIHHALRSSAETNYNPRFVNIEKNLAAPLQVPGTLVSPVHSSQQLLATPPHPSLSRRRGVLKTTKHMADAPKYNQ